LERQSAGKAILEHGVSPIHQTRLGATAETN
jgi:hypothetical protein